MKILDFDTRSAIAKESITRVCEENQNMNQQQVTNTFDVSFSFN